MFFYKIFYNAVNLYGNPLFGKPYGESNGSKSSQRAWCFFYSVGLVGFCIDGIFGRPFGEWLYWLSFGLMMLGLLCWIILGTNTFTGSDYEKTARFFGPSSSEYATLTAIRSTPKRFSHDDLVRYYSQGRNDKIEVNEHFFSYNLSGTVFENCRIDGNYKKTIELQSGTYFRNCELDGTIVLDDHFCKHYYGSALGFKSEIEIPYDFYLENCEVTGEIISNRPYRLINTTVNGKKYADNYDKIYVQYASHIRQKEMAEKTRKEQEAGLDELLKKRRTEAENDLVNDKNSMIVCLVFSILIALGAVVTHLIIAGVQEWRTSIVIILVFLQIPLLITKVGCLFGKKKKSLKGWFVVFTVFAFLLEGALMWSAIAQGEKTFYIMLAIVTLLFSVLGIIGFNVCANKVQDVVKKENEIFLYRYENDNRRNVRVR